MSFLSHTSFLSFQNPVLSKLLVFRMTTFLFRHPMPAKLYHALNMLLGYNKHAKYFQSLLN